MSEVIVENPRPDEYEVEIGTGLQTARGPNGPTGPVTTVKVGVRRVAGELVATCHRAMEQASRQGFEQIAINEVWERYPSS